MEAESRDVVKDIFKACYGLVFFSVPNLGLRHEQLREMAKSNPMENLIKDLLVDNDSEQSALLETLRKRFHTLCKAQELRIDIYYERRKGLTVKVSSQHFLENIFLQNGPRSLRLEFGTGLVNRP